MNLFLIFVLVVCVGAFFWAMEQSSSDLHAFVIAIISIIGGCWSGFLIWEGWYERVLV